MLNKQLQQDLQKLRRIQIIIEQLHLHSLSESFLKIIHHLIHSKIFA
jgi:hypothetical protein